MHNVRVPPDEVPSRVAWFHVDAGDGWHLTMRYENLSGRWSLETYTFDELDDLLEHVRRLAKARI